jgi:small subunit ribosomal protein S5
MTEENTNTNPEVAAETVAAEAPAQNKTFAPRGNFRGGQGGRPGGRPGGRDGRGGRGGRPERQKPEFEQKMIDVRRVTRVVSGGRRFSFSVALVIGDRKGHVGFGIGKIWRH